ncbi:MAG: type II secretion system F family protein, partial [Thermoplasmata archaeon]
VYGTTVVAAVVLAVAGITAFVFVGLLLGDLLVGALFLALPVAAPLVFILLQGSPAGTAKTRGRQIDRRISIAMNFMSAMASADVNIDQIFKELSDQHRIYGEVADEAAWITRDTELLGVDILTAIRIGAARSPSKRFQDFLQGVVTTATSGGQFKPYFLLKAEQYERENKLAQLQRTETMGLMAEVFVIGVVAFPLFLIIILAIFAIIGGNGGFVLELLWVIVGLVVPLIEFGFIFIMHVFATEI